MTTKIVLITGGSRGLGKSAALHLAAQGTGVIVTYHQRADAAQEVVDTLQATGTKAVALRLDVGDVGSFGAFADQLKQALSTTWGRDSFDFLVNNGGIGINSPIAETTEAQFDQLLNIHFKGVFFLTQALLPLIADHGKILNISSGLTRLSRPGFAAYAAMKGAVEVLTRYLATELAPRRITANTLAPGAIATDFGGGFIRDNPEYSQMIADGTALGRVGQPDDIGAAIAMLLSDHSRWINAQRIEASGGVFI